MRIELELAQSRGELVGDCDNKTLYLPNNTRVNIFGVRHATEFFLCK